MKDEIELIFKRNTMSGSGRVDVETAIPQLLAIIDKAYEDGKVAGVEWYLEHKDDKLPPNIGITHLGAK